MKVATSDLAPKKEVNADSTLWIVETVGFGVDIAVGVDVKVAVLNETAALPMPRGEQPTKSGKVALTFAHSSTLYSIASVIELA